MTEHKQLIAEIQAARTMPSPRAARRLRRRAGISQERMARALEVDRSTLARWESGAMTPRPNQRERWRALLDELQRELAS